MPTLLLSTANSLRGLEDGDLFDRGGLRYDEEEESAALATRI